MLCVYLWFHERDCFQSEDQFYLVCPLGVKCDAGRIGDGDFCGPSSSVQWVSVLI